jgi:hypothetical protein
MSRCKTVATNLGLVALSVGSVLCALQAALAITKLNASSKIRFITRRMASQIAILAQTAFAITKRGRQGSICAGSDPVRGGHWNQADHRLAAQFLKVQHMVLLESKSL